MEYDRALHVQISAKDAEVIMKELAKSRGINKALKELYERTYVAKGLFKGYSYNL